MSKVLRKIFQFWKKEIVSRWNHTHYEPSHHYLGWHDKKKD